MARIWLCAVHPSTGRLRLLCYTCARRVRPSRSRISQRASISTATAARPLARPIQMPTPFQSAAERQPDADAEADDPIANEREEQAASGCRGARAAFPLRSPALRRPAGRRPRRCRKLTARAIATAFAGTSVRNKVTSWRGMLHMTSAIAAHEANADDPCGPARASDPRLVAAAERQADPNRCRLAKAQRDHEGECGDLQRDRMSGDRRSADPAHEISGEREHAHLERHGDADRPAEADHRIVRCRSKRHKWPNRWNRRKLPLERGDRDERAAQDEPGERASEASAGKTERRQAEMAEDQRPAEQRVERQFRRG